MTKEQADTIIELLLDIRDHVTRTANGTARDSMRPTMDCPHCGKPTISLRARELLNYMRRENRGFYFEEARPAYEAGRYRDDELDELLRVGAIEPHPDPEKGWVLSASW